MAEEQTKRKNPDYTATAVNLRNPPEVLELLKTRQQIMSEISTLDAVLKAYPEYENMIDRQEELSKLETSIRAEIDAHGSYQDAINGIYAVKQLRKTIIFLADKIRQVIPQYAEAVIDGVNKTKMNGLLKGGLISQEQADKCSEVKEEFAYIVR